MLGYTYVDKNRFELAQRPLPGLTDPRDAIVRITLASICTSDLHIKHGSVPRARKGIIVGHEAVGIVTEVGNGVRNVAVGDRVAINVETFCGQCFFCKHGFVNNCTDANGGWALGCRIDGVQAEYVRVPYADCGLSRIPDGVSDESALFTGDLLSTGYWAADITDIGQNDTVLIIGAGPTGICTLQCVLLASPERVIVCELDEVRRSFVRKHYPDVIVCSPEDAEAAVKRYGRHGGADRVIEVAGSSDSFALAWKCARPNAIVTVVAMYDEAQSLPLPDMYGKNLTFKTGGVDGCKCDEILALIAQGRLDTRALITHTFALKDIDKAYELFERKKDGVIKIAVRP